MSSKAPPRERKRLSALAVRLTLSLLMPAAAIAVGAALFSRALPIAAAGLLEIPGNATLRQLQEERDVGEPALRRFIRSREAAAEYRNAARTYTDIALGQLILGKYSDASPRNGSPAAAETVLIHGLGLAPMSPYGWMRLVQLRIMRGAPPSEIAGPLRLALRSGPHEDRRHAMLLLFVEAGFSVWSELDVHQRRLIEDKARYAFSRDAAGAVAAAIRAGRADLLAGALGF